MRHPRTTIAVLLLAASLPALAAPPSPTAVPALFLSDIHLDPYHDPAKAAKLNAAPAADWPAILAQPDAPTQLADYAALQASCPVRGIDTPNALWQSSLAAIHTNAAHARFVTISGDLLAHQFDCKFKQLLPNATHADYLTFVDKTIRTIVSGLRQALPGVPIYVGMGNNDSGCTDYALDATHDEFLSLTAKIVADSLPADLPKSDRDAALHDFTTAGNFNVPLAAVPHTRLISLDDLFLSARYATCAGKPDPAPAAAQLVWLETQLSAARQNHEHVWFMSHIPPGVNLYATARAFTNICGGAQPQMFLGSEKLEEILAANSDVVSLALFGHTHSDEMRLLLPESATTQRTTKNGERTTDLPGVPLKVVASITPVNGNHPSFTLATIDPATATLVDYAVIMASNLTGIATTWAPKYTYSAAYGKPAFDAAAVTSLIAGFQADSGARSPASQAYQRGYTPGTLSPVIQIAWPQYACSLNHDSAASFTACACATLK